MPLTRREAIEVLLRGSAACLCGVTASDWIPLRLAGSRSGVSQSDLAAGTQRPPDTLKSLAAKKGLLFGCATRSYWLTANSPNAALTARECSVIVPEFEMKWDYVEPESDKFAFQFGDQFVAFCSSQQIALRGHALVWHYSLPRWVSAASKSELPEILRRHVDRTVSHFAGHIHTWDVVNEPIKIEDNAPGGLRRSLWWSAVGPNYIESAFRIARAADPKARLAINENGLEYGDVASRAKRSTLLRLLESLVRSSVPVTTLGIQAHLDGNRSPRQFASLRQFLAEVAALGLSLQITELDVQDAKLPQAIRTRDALVAQQYAEFLSIALDEPAVEAVLTWGLSNANSWLSGYAPRADKSPVRPLLWDAGLQPTPAYTAVENAISAAPVRAPKTR